MRERARTDLCGGRSAMIVPTATVDRIGPPLSDNATFRPLSLVTRMRSPEIKLRNALPIFGQGCNLIERKLPYHTWPKHDRDVLLFSRVWNPTYRNRIH